VERPIGQAWVRRLAILVGARAKREEIKRLKRENFELRRANEILKAALAAGRTQRQGSQHTSAAYTQARDDHRVLALVGSVGDAYNNALAESFVDSFKPS
jgi:transposase InsO family protein